MKRRDWLFVTVVAVFGMLSSLTGARAEWDGNVGPFCATYKLPGGCLSGPGARCNRLTVTLRDVANLAKRREKQWNRCFVIFTRNVNMAGRADRAVGPLSRKNLPWHRCGVAARTTGAWEYVLPIASDVDCAGGCGKGPAFVKGPFKYKGTDIYGLDADNNGVACERPCED